MLDYRTENIIEITWMFDELMQLGDIPSWDDLIDEYGSDGLKNVIKEIARKFEEKYPFVTTWINTDLHYIEEIGKFAKEKLMEQFQHKDEHEPYD